jgi:Mrp family chromosome partitioning ATPase
MPCMATRMPGEPTLAGAAWRYRFLVLVAVVAFLAAALVYAVARGPVYSATATLELLDPHSASVFASSSGQPPDRYVGDQITVLKSPQLAAAAAALGSAKKPPLGLSADYFSTHTMVSGTPSTGSLVQLTFTARDAATALAGVDTVVTSYENVVRAALDSQLSAVLSQIDAELTSINAQLGPIGTALARPAPPNQAALQQQQQALLSSAAVLSQKRDQVMVDSTSPTPGVVLYLPPKTPTHTSSLLAALPVLSLALIAGLVVGVGAAYVLAFRRRVFLSRTEPESVLNAPLVGDIPGFDPTVSPIPAVAGATRAGVALRGAALFIQSRRSDGGAQRLAIVSGARRQGRSTITANLGLALASSGLRILFVDADPTGGGLSRLLRSEFESTQIHYPASIGAAGLTLEDVILPGLRGEVALLGLDRNQPRSREAEPETALAELARDFHVVLIDTPPLTDIGPFLPLVRQAERALVIVRSDAPVASVEEAARLLTMIDLPALGYIYTHPARRGRVRGSPSTPPAESKSFDIEYRPIEKGAQPKSELSA